MILFVLFVPIIMVHCRPEPQGYNQPKALTSYGTPVVNNYADNGLNGNYLSENQAPVNSFPHVGYNYPENQSYKPNNDVSTNNNYNNQNNVNNGSPGYNYGDNGNQTPNNQSNNPGVIVHKHVYFHVPPPDNEEEQKQNRPYQLPPSQKHYKIIFIKAPSHEIRQSQNIPLQQNEEKTIVYVLVKKPEDITDVQLPTIPPTAPSKPEVYFIKYKTQKSTNGGGYPNSVGNNGEISITTASSVGNGESGNNVTPAGIIQGGSISDAILNGGVSITDSVTETTTIPSYTTYTTPGVTGPY